MLSKNCHHGGLFCGSVANNPTSGYWGIDMDVLIPFSQKNHSDERLTGPASGGTSRRELGNSNLQIRPCNSKTTIARQQKQALTYGQLVPVGSMLPKLNPKRVRKLHFGTLITLTWAAST